MTEIEIGQELDVNQSTVSRDIKVLKELSQQFVSDLAKSDLAYYYKQCIDGIEEVRRKGWDLFKEEDLIARDKILALKVIRECNEKVCTIQGRTFYDERSNPATEVRAN